MNTSAETIETEEYAVYSSLIESWYINNDTRLIVIEDHSERSQGSGALHDELELLMQVLPDAVEETMENFKTRNMNLGPLKPLFSLSVPYVLIGNNELEDIFQKDRDGWDEFYQRYPNSPGTITLSRVGFNTVMNRALVYIGIQSHWRAGSGHYVVLKKENDAWSVQGKKMIWIS